MGASHLGEQDQDGHAQERYEVYGPLSIERQLEPDGRALIFYSRLEDKDR